MSLERVTARGHDSLVLATRLLQRQRVDDPHGGVWDAADLQWWWRLPRCSDGIDQVFWLDEDGPVAGVVLTDWTRGVGRWSCDPIFVPRLDASLRETVWEEALSSAQARVDAKVGIAVRDDDAPAIERLTRAGYTVSSTDTTAWLPAEERQPVGTLPRGYRLVDRAQNSGRPHHLAKRNGPATEARLRETSLYHPSLDLAVLAPGEEVAAYGLFWFDPVTQMGLVEPMRTEAEHQRKGLAGHVLRAGVQRLAERGASRIKIGYRDEAAGSVYRAAGFVPSSTVLYFSR